MKLKEILKKSSGRNSQGKVTVRHQGGGVKRFLRRVDFRRDKIDIPATVESIEYDPNRNANIALVCYKDGERRYILAPLGLKVGDTVISSDYASLEPGNALPLSKIPVGTQIHNIEIKPGKGGQIVRGAGLSASVFGKEKDFVLVKLPSGEVRRFNGDCRATIGQVGNEGYRNIVWGKAGRIIRRGIRPTVRGTAQHPASHPHGGGEGRSGVGMKHPKTPYGKPAVGRTRKKRKYSDKLIVKPKKAGNHS